MATNRAYRVSQRDHQGWDVWLTGEPEPVSRGFGNQDDAVHYAARRAAADHLPLVVEDEQGNVIEMHHPRQ